MNDHIIIYQFCNEMIIELWSNVDMIICIYEMINLHVE